MILTAAAVVGIALLLQVIVLPVLDRRRAVIRQIEVMQKDRNEMISLAKEYRGIRQKGMTVPLPNPNRDPSFTLFSFIDQLARRVGVKENVVYMKPSTKKGGNGSGRSAIQISIVKIKLEYLPMEKFVDFLHGIEMSGKGVHINKLSLTTSGTERTLTAIVETQTVVN